MKKFAVLFATIICFAMVSGSFAATNQNTDKNPVTILAMHKLEVVLPSNPSTGYHWEAVYNHHRVNLVSEEYLPDFPIKCGSGGQNRYVFNGFKGEKIVFKYVAPGINGKVAKTCIYYMK